MIINTKAYEWLIWGVSKVPTGDLAPDESARIEAGRERANGLMATTEEIALRWKNDSTLHRRFVGNGYRLSDTWRHYATFEFADRQVDIEVFSGIGGGPGFAFKDVRLYLDGLVVGRAWCGACSLGFGGGAGPAIAMLRDDLALCVVRPNTITKERVVVKVKRPLRGLARSSRVTTPADDATVVV